MNIFNTRCEIIDWRITARCNNSCNFCYASEQIQSADSETKKVILQKIIKSGCKSVCISGGEPLLDPDTLEIVERLNQAHIEVFLSTNGSEYMKYREHLEPLLTKLSLSLDGYDETSQAINGRNGQSFIDVVNILDYYRNHSHRFTIKVGTLLSKRNLSIEHFQKMFQLLEKYPIDLWKIYEFIPEGRGLTNQEEYAINLEQEKVFLKQFYEFQIGIQESYKFPCSLITREMRSAAYFIIRPDGKVIIPIDSQCGVTEEIVGDLTVDPIRKVIENWDRKIDNIKYNSNTDSRNITKLIPRVSIDDIDRKILYLLDLDPLQDEKQLKQNLKNRFDISIGRDVISAKIQALFGSHALYRIMPVVNVANFGLNVFLLNLYFKYSIFMDAEKIGQALACKPYIAWVVQCKEYNANDNYLIFRISIFAKDIRHLQQYEDELRDAFEELLYAIEIDLVPDKYILEQTYLLEKIGEELTLHEASNAHIELGTTNEKLTSDEFAVINAMNDSSHLTFASIAEKTHFDNKKISEIIRCLLKKHIINKFDVVLDANVLGYYVYLILVKFETANTKKEFEEYIKICPNATHINTLIMGTWDMDVEIRVNNISTWATIWTDIEEKYHDKIKAKKLIRIEKEYNFKFLIGVTLDAMRNSIEDKVVESTRIKNSANDRLRRK